MMPEAISSMRKLTAEQIFRIAIGLHNICQLLP